MQATCQLFVGRVESEAMDYRSSMNFAIPRWASRTPTVRHAVKGGLKHVSVQGVCRMHGRGGRQQPHRVHEGVQGRVRAMEGCHRTPQRRLMCVLLSCAVHARRPS